MATIGIGMEDVMESTVLSIKVFSVVVAVDAKYGIGKSGSIPWKNVKDIKYFKDLTSTATIGKCNAVIMGRKTYESIPLPWRPLSNRLNIVITKDPGSVSMAMTASSLDHALRIASDSSSVDKIFVIGGAQVYSEALAHPLCGHLYITRIFQDYLCDVYFTPVDVKIYRLISSSQVEKFKDVKLDKDIEFTFEEYDRV